MRRSNADKAITHSKILAVAAKRFRERGLTGIGVADVMKEAGTSVGGFYKHFASRDELVVEALAEAFKDLEGFERDAESLSAYLEDFLTEGHRDRPGTGCGITALAGDMRHASSSVRTVFTQRVKQNLGYYANRVKGGDAESKRLRAILLLSAAVGGMSLARAVNDKVFSREILKALGEELNVLAKRPMAKRVRSRT